MTGDGWAAIAAAFAASGAVVIVLARLARRLPLDVPNDRSLHVRAVPRAGGYALWAGFLPVALWFPPVPAAWGAAVWALPWLAVALVSAADDARGVAARVRLVVHCAAAIGCAGALWHASRDAMPLFEPAGIATIMLLGLAIAWSANLFNFMDGSDGLAGAMALVGFGAYGVAAQAAGASGVAFFALAAATLPFLAVNRPHATMFLGDVGAVPLGFLAGAFGVAGILAGDWPAWFPPLVFLPFIADASVTLARRLLRGAPLAVAHREHYYQRLNQLGAGHAGTLAAYAAAMVASATTALACLAFAPALGVIALGGATVVCFILFAAIDRQWRTRSLASR